MLSALVTNFIALGGNETNDNYEDPENCYQIATGTVIHLFWFH